MVRERNGGVMVRRGDTPKPNLSPNPAFFFFKVWVVSVHVSPKQDTVRKCNWKVERLVTLERETGGNDNATGDSIINPVGSTSPSSSISPSPESSGCCHE